MHDLTGFQRDLLYVIAALDEPKGLDVSDEIEQYYDAEIRNGRLYPNLDTLVNKAWSRRDSMITGPTSIP